MRGIVARAAAVVGLSKLRAPNGVLDGCPYRCEIAGDFLYACGERLTDLEVEKGVETGVAPRPLVAGCLEPGVGVVMLC